MKNKTKNDGYRCLECGCGWSEDFALSKHFICGDRPDPRKKHCHGVLIPSEQFQDMFNNHAAAQEIKTLDEIFLETYDIMV